MSVSLIALRLEIAAEFSLLPHLHFSVLRQKRPMALTDSSQKKVDGTNEISSPAHDASSKPSIDTYRGLRELQEISIETLHSDEIRQEKLAEKSESAVDSACSLDVMKPESQTKVQSKEKRKPPIQENKSKVKANGAQSVNASKKSVAREAALQKTKITNEKPEVAPSTTQESSNKGSDSAKMDIPSKDLDADPTLINTEDNTRLKENSQKDSDTNISNSERRSRLMLPSQISFSSGNHFVEVTKGLLHLYKENQRTPMAEEAERSEMLCLLAVPAVLTTHDLLQFTAPFNDDIEHMRIIREAKPNLYMVLMKFRNQLSADEFYKNFNGMKFNTIEEEVCHLAFVAKVETVKESEQACLPLPGHTELPTCPVCLERMDESVEGILTILCNHSFHGSCLAKWGDTSCPVCRYCQTPEPTPDNRCFRCGSLDSLWICLICGHIGCGRYVDGHAYHHYLDTQHTYAMQLGNNRVWDYAGDNYVHRLVQNKTDGKLVELEPRWVENEEKMDSMQLEYTYLLTSQLEAQRHYFEDRISRFETEAVKQLEEMKVKTKHAVDERKQLEEKLCRVTKEKQSHDKKITQLTSKLNKIVSELKDEKEMNRCLRQNQQLWQQKLNLAEKSLKELKDCKDKEVQDLQEQVRDLMFYFEAQSKLQDVPNVSAQEIQEGQIVIGEAAGTSTETAKPRRKKNR